MPYIAPNTTVYILKGIPLDNSYEHTVAYPSADIQFSEFIRYKKFELEKLSYQRVGAGLMRVQLTYEQMYDCNYMMFQNTSYGNKWWYAFITGVAYVNNSVCEISYQIDVMQTWAYDYEFMSCFVDREHVNPDTEKTTYKNYTQPEGLELGKNYVQADSWTVNRPPVQLLCLIAGDTTEATYDIDNIPSGLDIHLVTNYLGGKVGSYKTADAEKNAYLNGLNNMGLADSVYALYMAPTLTDKVDDSNDNNSVFPDISKGAVHKFSASLNGYTPKNKKLYTYPFNYCYVTNNMGDMTEWHFEDFTATENAPDTGLYIQWNDLTCRTPIPVTWAVPMNYRGMLNDFDSACHIDNYPTCAFTSDTFKAWWAQNKNSYNASLANIQRSYNTEMANIGNSFAQADVQIRNSYANSMLSADVTATNSRASENTGLQNTTASNAYSAIESGAKAIGSLISLDAGGVASGLTGVGRTVVDQVAAQNTYGTNMSNINRSLGAAQTIAGNNASASRAVAELAKQASSLSALTNNQNATASLVAKKEDIMSMPNSAKGNASGSGIASFYGLYQFRFVQMCVKPEYLRMIDDYFEKYGYKISQMKTPSKMNNRPYWHYLQTAGCNIKGDFNDTDITAIKTIYNNGITTWNALENVGNYSLNNH